MDGWRDGVLESGVAHAGREGRINVLPWCRLVVPPVTRTDAVEKMGLLAQVVATWYDSLPNSQPLSAAVRECARVTGKAGENGQRSGEMGGTLTLDKTGVAVDWVTGLSYSVEWRRLSVQSGLRTDEVHRCSHCLIRA